MSAPKKPILELAYIDTGEKDLQRAWRRRGVSPRIIDRIDKPFPRLRTEGRPPRILDYDFIIGEKDITKLLSAGPIIVFYPTAASKGVVIGHWTALMQTSTGINFYDPYGEIIDAAKMYSEKRKSLYKERENTLIRLLIKSGQPVDYSHHVHQYWNARTKVPVATCGWHCLTRCYFSFLTNDQYDIVLREMAKKLKISTDDTVAIFWNGL